MLRVCPVVTKPFYRSFLCVTFTEQSPLSASRKCMMLGSGRLCGPSLHSVHTHTFSSHLHIIVRETDDCQHDKSAFKPIPQLLNPGPLLLPSFDTCSKHPEMLLCSDTMSSARWTSCIRSGPMCFPCGTFSLLSLQNSKPGCRRPTKIVVSCGWSYQSSYTPPLVLPWRPGGHRPSGPQDQILPAA